MNTLNEIYGSDKLHEECGVFGIYDMGDGLDVSRLTYYGLYALQHRGQESAGIAVNSIDENERIQILQYKDMGLVQEVFNNLVLNELKGRAAVGHVRYTTAGSSSRENAQPLVTKYQKGTFAMVHNGNIVDVENMRTKLQNEGAIFHTNNDSEIIAQLIAKKRIKTDSIHEALLQVMDEISGAYSLIIMTPKRMIVVRDPQGFRPLCIGKLRNSYVFASETCALDSVGAEFVRDVEPGEVIVVDENGMRSYKDKCGCPSALCVFEYVYVARPDSVVDGVSVHGARLKAGRFLAKESPVDADVVIGVPDSGLDAALGYSRESGIPYGVGFIKNKYIGRTFIQPTQEERESALRIKLNAIREAVDGKRVIMIDDSIVRGTTSGRIVQLLRDAGAKEVHVRISSPPFKNPCYFGIDVADRESLIACQMSVEETCKFIGADSLAYLSLSAVEKIAEGSNCGRCYACFTGEYPVYVPQENKTKYE